MKKFLVACLALVLALVFGVNAMAAKAEAFVIKEPCTIDGEKLEATITCIYTNLEEEKDSFIGYTEGCAVTAKQDGYTTTCKVTEPATGILNKMIASEASQELVYKVTLFNIENPFAITFTFDNGKTYTKNFIIKGNAIVVTEPASETPATLTDTTTEPTTKATTTEPTTATPTDVAGPTDGTTTLPTTTETPTNTIVVIDSPIPNTGSNGLAIGVFSGLAILAGCGGAFAITKKQKKNK